MNLRDWLGMLRHELTAIVEATVAWLPNLLGALVLLLLGWAVGRVVAFVLERASRVARLDAALRHTAAGGLLERAGVQRPPSALLGTLGFWVTFLLFLIAATETLRFPALARALTVVAGYLPQVGLALLIVLVGLLAAGLLRDLVGVAARSAGLPQAGLLGRLAFVVAGAVAGVMALHELGVDTTLLNTLLMLAAGGLVVGMALSFGLGARQAVSSLIAARYLEPLVRVGDRVELDGAQGEVVAITRVAVVVQAEGRRQVVPAARFMEQGVVIHTPER